MAEAARSPQTGQFVPADTETAYVESRLAEAAVAEAAATAAEAPPAPEPEVPGAEETPAASPTPEPEQYTVKVEGQDEQVTLAEMQKGYIRQETFTRRSQLLAREAEQLQEQREMFERLTGRPQAGLGTTSPANQRPAVPIETGAWNTGGSGGTSVGEYPSAATPPRQASPEGNYGEDEEDGQVRTLRQEVQRLSKQVGDTYAMQQHQAYERMQQEGIAALSIIHPGFDKALVEEQLALMPVSERRVLEAQMDKARQYEIVWLRLKAHQPQATATPAKKETTETEPEAPPQSETPRGTGPEPAPDLTAPMPSDRDGMIAWMENLNKGKAIKARR